MEGEQPSTIDSPIGLSQQGISPGPKERSSRSSTHSQQPQEVTSSFRRPTARITEPTKHIQQTGGLTSPTAFFSERAAIASVTPVHQKTEQNITQARPVQYSKRDELDKHSRQACSHRSRDKQRHSRRHHSSSSSSSDHRQKHRRSSKHRRKYSSSSRSSSEESRKSYRPSKRFDECKRCGKERLRDPFDPSQHKLSDGQSQQLKRRLIRRVENLKEKYSEEPISVPPQTANVAGCYRQYRRTVQHLYAKKSISTYRVYMMIFSWIVQIAMSILFGPAAADYLKKEFATISKYDAVFYEMGCKKFIPHTEPMSPQYQLAVTAMMPIIMIAGTGIITKFTGLSPELVSSCGDMIMKSFAGATGETEPYKTALDPDDDESETDCDDEEVEQPQTGPRERAPPVPNIEDMIPSDNPLPGFIQATSPAWAGFMESTRPGAKGEEGGSKPAGAGDALANMLGPLASMMMNMGGGQQPKQEKQSSQRKSQGVPKKTPISSDPITAFDS